MTITGKKVRKMKYTHTKINTPNWEELIKFYENVFDMKVVPPLRDLHGDWFEAAAGLKGAHVKGAHLALPGYPEGGPTIEFFTWEISDGTPANKINGGGMGHIAIAVDDVEAVYRKVEANGGSACGEIARHYYETKDQTLTLVYAKDPDGNVIEIQRWDDGDITK